MRTEKIICDGCGSDLTVRIDSADYRLELRPEIKANEPGSNFLHYIPNPPLLDRTYHFCSLDCLDRWRKAI